MNNSYIYAINISRSVDAMACFCSAGGQVQLHLVASPFPPLVILMSMAVCCGAGGGWSKDDLNDMDALLAL